MKKEFGVYQVGMKLLLRRKDGKILLLRLKSGKYDLPGGRIDSIEYKLPLKKILAREISEELGKDVKYAIGPVIFQYHFPHQNGAIFQTVFGADYLSGQIKLSFEHKLYEWVDPKTLVVTKKSFPVYPAYYAFSEYIKSHY